MRADTGGGQQKPELIVAGVGQKGEEDGHAGCAER